jgi:hypothetical protein
MPPPRTCRSWPHCRSKPAKGRRFCDEHQKILDKVQAEVDPSAYRRAGKEPIAIEDDPAVTIKQIAPTPAAAERKPRRLGVPYKEMILSALKDGELSGGELAKRCDCCVNHRTFCTARRALIAEGAIKNVGKGGRASRYALCPAPSVAT